MKKFADKIASDEATSLDFLYRSKRVHHDGGSCDADCRTVFACEVKNIDPYRTE